MQTSGGLLLALGLFLASGCLGTLGSPRDDSITFGVPSTVRVSGDKMFKVGLPADLAPIGSSIPTTISIWSYVSDLEYEDTRVNFVAIHGKNSETWQLKSGQDTNITLCIEAEENITSIIIIAQAEGISASKTLRTTDLDFHIQKQDRVLEFGPNGSETALITSGSPLTLLINHSSRKDAQFREHFVLTVENKNDTTATVCAVVVVQNRQCPLKNRPNNFETSEMYATMLTTATLTIKTTKFKFLEPFYVNIIVLPNDNFCKLEKMDHLEANITTQRQKLVSISIKKGPSYSSYVAPIGIALVGMSTIIILSSCVLLAKTYKTSEKEHFAPEMSRMNSSGDHGGEKRPVSSPTNGSSQPVDTVDAATYDGDIAYRDNGEDQPAGDTSDDMIVTYRGNGDHNESAVVFLQNNPEVDDPDGVVGLPSSDVAYKLSVQCRTVIDSRPKHRKIRIKKGLNRLREDATLKDMASILNDDIWFRRNRSRVYLYLIPIVSIFYFVPAIQFAFLAKLNEDKTGSQDLCFHNFKCAMPFSIFSDFNHVVSNMSYIIFGLAFIILVYVKSIRLPEKHHPKNDHNTNTGILQQLSIFYSMGFGLVFQGLFSVCYHVCPTNLSLQFDTTMMYIICLLCYIKIYQFRHPDATPNAYSVFMFIGILVLLEALALYFSSWWVFGPFLIFYITMTVFIAFDCYYIGIGRLDRRVAIVLAKDIISNWRPALKEGTRLHFGFIRYPWRFFFAMLFCFVNFTYAMMTIYSKWHNPNKNVSHVVLTILAGNMMLYLFYYVVRKNCCGSGRPCCKRQNTDSEDGKRTFTCVECNRRVTVLSMNIPIPLSAGSFFSFGAFILGSIALMFYYDRTANRNFSPAESRNLNAECTVMGFYDGHDLWHFFGAAGIFQAFLALLTVDDDLLEVPRSEIIVF